MDAVVISLSIVAILGAGELAAKFTPLSPGTLRKVVHATMGIVVVLLTVHYSYRLFIPIGLVAACAMWLTHRYRLLDSLRDRRDESHGEVYFALGVAAAAIISPDAAVFQTSLLIMAIADTCAYAVGRRLSSPNIYRKKTFAGSAAFLVVTTTILLAYETNPVLLAVTGLYCTAAEMLSDHGIDNFTVPLLASLLLGNF